MFTFVTQVTISDMTLMPKSHFQPRASRHAEVEHNQPEVQRVPTHRHSAIARVGWAGHRRDVSASGAPATT